MLGITLFFYLFLSTPRDLWLPQEQFDWMYCDLEMRLNDNTFLAHEQDIRSFYRNLHPLENHLWFHYLNRLEKSITYTNNRLEEARQKARRELLMRWISNSRREWYPN